MSSRSDYGPNPFTPEVGRKPPHLAGRDENLAWWQTVLADGKAASEGRLAVLYGPRGTGKTAVLSRFGTLAAAAGCDVVRTNVTLLDEGRAGMADRLLAEVNKPDYRQQSRETSESAAVKVGGTGGEVAQRHTEAYADPMAAYGPLSARLKAHAQATPLALLIDEAHAAKDLRALQAIVNAAQEVAEAAPCFVLLAGTPGLPRTLKEAGCTFTERANEFGIDLLDSAAAIDAIRTPLASSVWRLQDRAHLSIDDHALASIVEDSQGYPYFLQMWGHEMWKYAAAQNKGQLTMEDQAVVWTTIDEERRGFYATRYRTMGSDLQLLAAADAVSKRFQVKDRISHLELFLVIKKSLEEDIPDEKAREAAAAELEQELNRIDYFWYPPKAEKAEPGIPSFMTYISEQYAEKQALEQELAQ